MKQRTYLYLFILENLDIGGKFVFYQQRVNVNSR